MGGGAEGRHSLFSPYFFMNTKKVEFEPPTGFTLPEGVGRGDDFDAVCTFRVKEDGTICLTRLGDTPMPGYGEKPERKRAYTDVAQEMQAARPVMNQEGSY